MFFVFDCITEFSEMRPNTRELSEEEQEVGIRSKIGEGISYPALHRRMLAWVGIWIENNGTPRKQLSWSGDVEKEGFKQLFDGLNHYKDFGLIHFGARSNHLPMFTYKAMQYQLVMPLRLSSHDITYRYSKHNIDLRDQLCNYGADTPANFAELLALINLPENIQKTLTKIALYGKNLGQAVTSNNDHELELETKGYLRVLCIYLAWLRLKHAQGDIENQHYEHLRNRGQKKLASLI